MQVERDTDPQPVRTEAPPAGAQHATALGTSDAPTNDAGTGDADTAHHSNGALAAPAVQPPTTPPVVPAPDLPAAGEDQATVLNLRREQLANGAALPAAEPVAHDAATYQDAPPGTPPAWRSPAAPPYVPQPPPRPPRGTLPRPRTHAPWRTAQSWGPTTFTVSADAAAGFSYLLWWLSGLIVYFVERNNRYVRFHALQSILLTSAFTVLGVVVYVLDALLHDLTHATHWTFFGALGSGLAVVVVVLGIIVPWLGTMIGAWTGHYIRWPIVGAYAERYAAPPLQIPGSLL